MSRMCSRGSSLALWRPLALLACLALLCGAAAATGCDTEKLAKAQLASSLPFTVDYQRSGKVDTTTFYFKVCSACPEGGAACQPLKAFRVRLADAVLAAPKTYIQSASPAGTVSATCAAGPGWWLKDVELGVLSEAPTDDECELFEVTVYNQGGKTTPLSAICQQNVVVQDAATGAVAFDQAKSGASCLYALELADGTVGVGALHDAEHDAVAAPPPHRPTPSPPKMPGYYYGASAHARRLQQAPFTVRSLLSSYYGGYTAQRRLASVDSETEADSPVVFATRRLMEASVVPLPRHLKEAARVPSHLTGGRQLSSYYYQGAAAQHRRSLMGLQPGTLFGRTLTTYYYGAGHRRSLMNVGQEATFGNFGRTLTGYAPYYSAGHRRSLMSAGVAGRTLTTYYYGSHRRMLSMGQEAAVGSTRSLHSYGVYYAGHRRSLMSSNTGRVLTSYYYSGNTHRRSLMSLSGTAGRTLTSYYGYSGSAHRRSLMSANGAARTLTTYYYGGSTAHRRSLLSSGSVGRQLSSYYYGGSTAHRRSLLSSGSVGRHLSSYYYGGSTAHRRSLLSSGSVGRHLSSYYYSGATAHRRLMSVGQEAVLGRSLLHSGCGYYGHTH